MLGLSRHFREKTDKEYLIFNLTFASAPDQVNHDVYNSSNLGGPSKSQYMEISWGDGDYSTTGGSRLHTYGATGTYALKVHGRVPEDTIRGWRNFTATGVDHGIIDLSNYKYFNYMRFPTATNKTVYLPNQYLGTQANLVIDCSSQTIQFYNLLDDTILNIDMWGSWSTISFANSTILNDLGGNLNRIKLPSSNPWTNAAFNSSAGFEAIGPSADDGSNYDANFTNQNLWSNLAVIGTGLTGSTGNIQRFFFPSSAFGTLGMGNFTITSTGATSIDISNANTSTSATKTWRFNSNPKLQQVKFPASINGNVYTYDFYDCDLTGHLDLSTLKLSNPQLNYLRVYNNPNLTELSVPPGSTAKYALFFAADCGLTGVYGTENYTQWGNQATTFFYFDNNALPVDMVNKLLVDLDAGSTGGILNRQMRINGGTNAAPDGSSGGYDGITAANNLVTKGFSVLTN